MDWVKIIETLEQILKEEGKNKAELPKILGVRSQYLSDLKSGKSKNPGADFTLALINRFNINPKWIETGEGDVFSAKSDIPQIEGNINALWNAGSVGYNNCTVVSPSKIPHPLTELDKSKRMQWYEIPLLTKKQAFHFDPNTEIPVPTAHSGEYPDITIISVPERIRVFGTDLRAIVVFNNQMSPVLNSGDIAIFEATGWCNDGIYLYRMNNDLHISYIKFDSVQFILAKGFLSKEEIACDARAIDIIGRVRAVLKEVS
ncbi:MAG: helix-turn-helix domain-containing protein [Spirochaetaceae bacterium]|nr:helix-turn-helix domain-containing protein [Spirochaetaceae bacterium]